MNATAQAMIKDVVEAFKGQPVPTEAQLRAKVEEVCKPFFNVDVNMIERHVQCEVVFTMALEAKLRNHHG